MMRLHVLMGLCLAVGVSACTPSAPTAATASTAATVKATAILTGTITVPNRFIGTGSSGVIPTGGGNVIPTGGGNALPLANAKVFLADASGQPYPSLNAVQTNTSGQFTFPAVPAGYTFMVVAQAHDTHLNKDVTLQTLATSSDLGTTAPIDVASSIVTLAVTEGQSSSLGSFNTASFRTATEATAKNLQDADIPDLSDRSAVLSLIDKLSSQITELKQAIDEIRQDLKDIKAAINDLQQKVDNQQQAPIVMAPSPPPIGQNPFGCAPPKLFDFTLKGTYTDYPLHVDFVNPVGHVVAQVYFATPGATAKGMVPTDCTNLLNLRNSHGGILASTQSFTAPSSGATAFTFPF